MQKDILLEMLNVSRFNCAFTFKDITPENNNFRLMEETASVGFIYRHIGETTNTYGRLLGFETDVKDTTTGQTDSGKSYDPETSKTFFEEGYSKLEKVIQNTPDDEWFSTVNVPFFGEMPKIKLLSIILSHNSHHCGQIASAIVKGKEYQFI